VLCMFMPPTPPPPFLWAHDLWIKWFYPILHSINTHPPVVSFYKPYILFYILLVFEYQHILLMWQYIVKISVNDIDLSRFSEHRNYMKNQVIVECIANYVAGRKHDDKRLNVNRIYSSNNCLCEEHVLCH
jgi:hypothetical protein